MKSCHLTFLSKNKNSLNEAFMFFLTNLNFKIVKKYLKKKTKKHFVTILKSPHVNKKAQEQFETFIFSKQLTLYPTKKFKYLFYLKKIQENLFSNVKLKIKFSLIKNNNLRLSIFNLNNFKLNLNKINQTNTVHKNIKIKKFNKNSNNKLKYFIKIIDVSGELHN